MWKIERIADYELGLMYRDRAFRQVLEPGVHRLVVGRGKIELRRLDLRQMPVRDVALAALVLTHRALVEELFVVVDMGDTEVAAVFADGKLVDLVGPGGVAFYAKRLRKITVEVFDVAAEIAVPEALVAPVSWLGAANLVLAAEVPSDHVGLLYVDGVLDRQLKPGRYAFFKAVRKVSGGPARPAAADPGGDRPGGVDQGPDRSSGQHHRRLPDRRSGQGGVRDREAAGLPVQGAAVRAAAGGRHPDA